MSRLISRIQQVSTAALAKNSLIPIPTNYTILTDANIEFIVRVRQNLQRKEDAKLKVQLESTSTGFENKQEKNYNPFLPYEEDMYVQDISDSHVCLLNKFNVVDNHVLLVTKDFQEQSSLLTLDDFSALWIALNQLDGLAFYNAGTQAGASQRHKHLQLIPVPLIPNSAYKTPFDQTLMSNNTPDLKFTTASLPFLHIMAKWSKLKIMPHQQAAEQSLQLYLNMIKYLDEEKNIRSLVFGDQTETSQEQYHFTRSSLQPFPYNLLATSDWLMLIPRSQECFQDISINAMGFAGSLFVKNEELLDKVAKIGPMTVLTSVSYPLE